MRKVFEKIIEEINNRIKTQIKIMAGLADETYRYGFGKSLEAYEQSKLIVEQAAAEDNNGWIPCSERLPEESLNSVLGFDEYRGRLCLVQYVGGRWILGNDIDSVKIIAWQPLPEPYQQKGE